MGEEKKQLEAKRDSVYLLILLAVAVIIGAYLIVTTTAIAKDGAFYIEQAKRLDSDPLTEIRSYPHPPGFPFLILTAHKLMSLICGNTSIFGWIYCGQIMSILCRVLAIVAMYFIGKKFVGARMSFWGLFILLLLPAFAKYGSDVLRDWPHMLFLAAGFLLMLWATEKNRWWLFGGVGLVSGLGYWIRNECIQVVVYAALWLLASLLLWKRDTNGKKLILGLVLLVAAFAISAGPYMTLKGTVLPQRLGGAAKVFLATFSKSEIQEARTEPPVGREFYPGFTVGNITAAFWKIANEFTEILKSFYMPALLIGIYYHFRKANMRGVEVFFMTTFIVTNVGALISQFGGSSRRYMLPLVGFTIFYVPVGLQVIASFIQDRLSNTVGKAKPKLCFFALIAIGVAICTPRLLRPLGARRGPYRIAAKWLKDNTEPESLIIAPDPRISFYAERKEADSLSKTSSAKPVYIVKILNEKNKELSVQEEIIQKEYSLDFYTQNRKYKLVVYKAR